MFAKKNLQELHVPKKHARKIQIVMDFILTLKRKNAKHECINVDHGVETSLRHWKNVKINACQIKVCKT